MKVVPLYDSRPLAAVQEVVPEQLTPSACSRCSLHKNAKNSCSTPRGKRGSDTSKTLLVVGEIAPQNVSGGYAAPFQATRGEQWFANTVERLWDGNVVYDYAIRCTSARKGNSDSTVVESHHNHCRPYLAQIYDEVKPDRVLVLGNHGAKGLLGYDRGGASNSNRRGYTWLFENAKDIPVFLVAQPEYVYENTFARKMFKDDLKWALNTDPPKAPMGALAYDLDPTQSDADFARSILDTFTEFSYDCETSGILFGSDFELLSVAIAFPNSDEVLVWFGEALDPSTPTGKLLQEVMESDRWGKKGQNLVYDVACIKSHFDVWVKGAAGDSRLAYKLLNSHADARLEPMAELVGMGGHKQEAYGYVEAAAKKIRKAFREENPGVKIKNCRDRAYAYGSLPREVNVRYVARDALTTQLLCDKVEKTLKTHFDKSLWRTYQEVSVPSVNTFARMMYRGVPTSLDMIGGLESYFRTKLNQCQHMLNAYGTVNPTSNPSKIDFLYNQLKLKPPRGASTKGGQLSVKKQVLEKLAKSHPAVQALLEYSEVEKLRGMIDSFKWQVEEDGRIRPSFLADGTETGRISVTGGLHQVPTRTEHGKMVKKCFVAKDGYVIMQADYSTLEIRVAAILSGDPVMKELLNSGIDFHLATAKLLGPTVWGLSPEEIEARHKGGDSTYRTVCKTINFATLYGQSAVELSQAITAMLRRDGQLGENEFFTEQEAEAAQKAILGQFSVLAEWIRVQQETVLESGDAWTWWDGSIARRRLLTDAGNSGRGDLRGSALRSSYNTPIQGTGAEFCNRSLNEIVRVLEEKYGDDAYAVMTVHDSIIFEVRDNPDLIRRVYIDVLRIMSGWNSEGVPLKVDFEVGKSWGQLEKYDG